MRPPSLPRSLQGPTVPVYAIYRTAGGRFRVILWMIGEGTASIEAACFAEGTLSEARRAIPPECDMPIFPMADDDPRFVECWI